MTFLIIIIIGGLIWYSVKIGFNFGSLIGGILGCIVGSSLGIAGSGGAASGTIIFGAIGFVIGGLIFKNWQNKDN
jgi:hypothetical protein|tara:strand:- start:39 stop:263 length:225 start_codon:yes stop_codon:yes gene_type:complete